MINGILVINKEEGFTSHDVVAKLRGMLKQKKIGHTGTLDPLATGVLPVCLGRATKLSDRMVSTQKVYKTKLQLGIQTDTDDITGTVISEGISKVSFEQVKETLENFLGKQEQLPPMYSAIKIKGRKLYELARAGEVVDRKLREINIYKIYDIKLSLPYLSFTVSCSKGTYIRSLCRDIGQKLGTRATMVQLLRVETSGFSIEDAHTLGEIQDLLDKNELPLISIEKVLSKMDRLICKKEAMILLENGNQFNKEMIDFDKTEADICKLISDNIEVLVFNHEKKLIGIYKYKSGLFYPQCMLKI